MGEMDRILEALHKNPYEKIHRRLYTCADCCMGIYKGDDHYIIGGGIYCEHCVQKSKILG